VIIAAAGELDERPQSKTLQFRKSLQPESFLRPRRRQRLAVDYGMEETRGATQLLKAGQSAFFRQAEISFSTVDFWIPPSQGRLALVNAVRHARKTHL